MAYEPVRSIAGPFLIIYSFKRVKDQINISNLKNLKLRARGLSVVSRIAQSNQKGRTLKQPSLKFSVLHISVKNVNLGPKMTISVRS